ncbi:hypothetical protein AMK17_34520 [Streptomyces sp. CB00072]|uniref:hypothetical protein n=1 Tax=Streptomyces sp. CB00072 TaxID=1703928 RepID=UPI00093AF667|nr:hypothetical protein [Streptomyces sp. CB00072]OKI50542.1 hypothetical protein AMK17_34520 [Streptomyces sp. CB00072]
MPAYVMDEPLAVHFVFPNGGEWTAALDGLPNPGLARDLAKGLAANAHPEGGIGAKNTAKAYGVALRQLVSALAEAGFTGNAPDLTRATLVRYWMASTYTRERETRMLLKGFDAVTGALRPEVRTYLTGNQIQAYRSTSPYKAYTDGEWERLETSCRVVVDDSWARHRRALELASQGGEPSGSAHHSPQDIAWLLLRDGPFPDRPVYRAQTQGTKSTQWELRRAVRQVRSDLFPHPIVQVAYSVLFGMYCGVVPDGIDDLGLDGLGWTGDTSIVITYIKGRTARESSNLPSRAVRLLERWLEYSAPLRSFADDKLRGQLWISYSPKWFTTGGGFSPIVGPPSDTDRHRDLVKQVGLVDDTGKPFVIHRGRIRATYHERLARRGWTGRATIDPNHTARTEGDHYVTPTSPAQLDAVESIIEDGQADVLRKALPPVVLSAEQAARFAKDFPDDVKRLELDAVAIAELVGGERDVFTAACADQLAGVQGPAGQPCPARPWVCLLCPLSVFLPRHAANLLRLNAFFSRQFRQMSTESFVRVFGPYADRLATEILPKLSEETKEKAAREVADDDTDLPLRPEEGTL